MSLCEYVEYGGSKFDTIAFAGPAKSGKSTVAREVSELLGWRYFGAGVIFRQVCADSGIEMSGAAAVDQTVHAGIEERMQSIMREGGGVVLDGRTPALIVREKRLSNVLTVLLTSSLVVRAGRAVQKSPGKYIDQTTAERLLESREKEDLSVFGEMYLWSYQDPESYHLAVDSSEMSKDETVEAIMGELVIVRASLR